MSILCLMVYYLFKSIILNKGNRSDVIFRVELILFYLYKKVILYFVFIILLSMF